MYKNVGLEMIFPVEASQKPVVMVQARPDAGTEPDRAYFSRAQECSKPGPAAQAGALVVITLYFN